MLNLPWFLPCDNDDIRNRHRHQLLVLDRKSLSALEQRFDDVTAVGHLHGEMASKLPLFHSMPSGDVHHDPRKARGRKHFDPRVVPWEKW